MPRDAAAHSARRVGHCAVNASTCPVSTGSVSRQQGVYAGVWAGARMPEAPPHSCKCCEAPHKSRRGGEAVWRRAAHVLKVLQVHLLNALPLVGFCVLVHHLLCVPPHHTRAALREHRTYPPRGPTVQHPLTARFTTAPARVRHAAQVRYVVFTRSCRCTARRTRGAGPSPACTVDFSARGHSRAAHSIARWL